jgi:hypothetical protein
MELSWATKDKEALEKFQQRAIKMVSGLGSNVYEERLQELGMTPLEERRHKLDMVQVYKRLGGYDTVKADHWFRLATQSENRTRQATGVLNLIKLRTHLEV